MEEGGNRKRNNYKLIVDPELQKGKKKVYRLNGSIAGNPPIADPVDPRVQKTVLGVIGKEWTLPLPRFKCDRFWVGDLPKRDVLITGANEGLQDQLRTQLEAIGPVYSLKFHICVQHKTTPVSVSYQQAGDGEKAVDRLNDQTIEGIRISVVLDDKGDNLRLLLDTPLSVRRPSTDQSAASTPTSKNLPPLDLTTNDIKSHFSGGPQTPSVVMVTSHTPSVSDSPSTSSCFSPNSMRTPSSIDSGVCLKPFDPFLSLRSSLGKLTNSRGPHSAPPLPPDESKVPLPPPPPTKIDEGIENISSDEEIIDSPLPGAGTIPAKTLSSNHAPTTPDHTPLDPRLNKNMWKPIGEEEGNADKYEMDFEEISGDESPVMMYNVQLEVEEISSDEGEGLPNKGAELPVNEGAGQTGSEDMEISDEDVSHENLIELNVQPTAGSKYHFPPNNTPLTPPMILPPPIPPVPMYPPPIPPPGYYPKPPYPPSDIFPPQPPISTPTINGYRETPSYKSPYFEKNRFSPRKQWRVPTANNHKERCGQNVLYRVLEQLGNILFRDYERKVIGLAAYPVLDRFWEKRERERREEQIKDGKVGEDTTEEGVAIKEEAGTEESLSEPYRRMLPGLIPLSDPSEDTPTTPRKRLMNFKIPFVRQRRDAVMVARRRLHEDTWDKRKRRRQQRDESTVVSRSKRRSRSPRYDLSDISSDELSSEDMGGDSEGEEASAFGPRTPPPESTDEGEESLNESDIFGTATVSSSSSDYEQEMKKTNKQKNRKRNRTVSTKGEDEPITLYEATPTPPSSPLPPKEEEVKVPKYRKRTATADTELIGRFLCDSFDTEDVLMMRLAYLRLRGAESELINDIPWAHYPSTVSSEPSSKRHKTLGEELHPTGCARSEGYYKIDPRDKTKYLPHLRRGKGETSDSKEKSTGSGRGNRLNHRRVASLFTSGDVSREIQQYSQLKARNKLLRFAKSTIHNWGLFALEDVPADEIVVEYVGQYVRQLVADERERRYESQGIGSSYLFRVDMESIIDATKSGNFARFINHCCDPNCYAKVISIGLQKKIVIYSKRDIRCGEEITYDYKFPIEDEKIPCLCGAPHCRGTLN